MSSVGAFSVGAVQGSIVSGLCWIKVSALPEATAWKVASLIDSSSFQVLHTRAGCSVAFYVVRVVADQGQQLVVAKCHEIQDTFSSCKVDFSYPCSLLQFGDDKLAEALVNDIARIFKFLLAQPSVDQLGVKETWFEGHHSNILCSSDMIVPFITTLETLLCSDADDGDHKHKSGHHSDEDHDEKKGSEEAPKVTAAHKWWWQDGKARADLLSMAASSRDSPLFVYSKPEVLRNIHKLKSITSVDRIFFAMKANCFAPILKIVFDAGFGFECVSPQEVCQFVTDVLNA